MQRDDRHEAPPAPEIAAKRAFIVIRHLRELGLYAIEYGRSVAALRPGPRFRDLRRAMTWIEDLEGRPVPALSRQIGHHRVQHRKP
jgi:hypothetical protein